MAEAGLSCFGAVDALGSKPSFPCLIADIDGGSTELILLKSLQSRPIVCSLPIGVAMYAERDQVTQALDLHLIADGIIKILGEAELSSPPMLVGTGGTASALASLDQGLTDHDTDKIQGYR